MIYLSPENRSAFGDETFWVWFERNFANTSYSLPSTYKDGDVVLRYSTMGAIHASPGKSVALCWELLPELKRLFNTDVWDVPIAKTYLAAQSCDRILITSEFSRKDYEPFGKVDILPIGVDTDLFRPYSVDEKHTFRLKYGVPTDKEVGFWCGTTHPMKGYQNVVSYAKENPDIYWVLVWYSLMGEIIPNSQNHGIITQKMLSELMNCADFQLSASILRPYYIVEYEGMACNLKQRKTSNIEKDFEAGDNPRDIIFEKQWDRHTCKILYQNYINNL